MIGIFLMYPKKMFKMTGISSGAITIKINNKVINHGIILKKTNNNNKNKVKTLILVTFHHPLKQILKIIITNSSHKIKIFQVIGYNNRNFNNNLHSNNYNSNIIIINNNNNSQIFILNNSKKWLMTRKNCNPSISSEI